MRLLPSIKIFFLLLSCGISFCNCQGGQPPITVDQSVVQPGGLLQYFVHSQAIAVDSNIFFFNKDLHNSTLITSISAQAAGIQTITQTQTETDSTTVTKSLTPTSTSTPTDSITREATTMPGSVTSIPSTVAPLPTSTAGTVVSFLSSFTVPLCPPGAYSIQLVETQTGKILFETPAIQVQSLESDQTVPETSTTSTDTPSNTSMVSVPIMPTETAQGKTQTAQATGPQTTGLSSQMTNISELSSSTPTSTSLTSTSSISTLSPTRAPTWHVIVGSTIGAIVVTLLIVSMATFILKRRKRNNLSQRDTNTPQEALHPYPLHASTIFNAANVPFLAMKPHNHTTSDDTGLTSQSKTDIIIERELHARMVPWHEAQATLLGSREGHQEPTNTTGASSSEALTEDSPPEYMTANMPSGAHNPYSGW